MSLNTVQTSPVTRPAESRAREIAKLAGPYVLVCLIWGTTWIGIKIAVTDMPPLISSGLRFLIAAPIFLALCRIRRQPMFFERRQLWFFAFVTMCYFALPFLLYNFGEQYISSGLTAICFAMVSVLMVLFSVPVLGTRVTALQIGCVTFAFLALAALVMHSQGGVSASNGWGIAAVLVAATMHAYAYVMVKKHGQRIHPLTLNTLPMTLAGVLLTGTGLIFERPGREAFTVSSISATLYLGVVASVIGFLVYFWLLQKLRTVTVSFVFVIFPVIAQIFAVVVENGSFGLLDFVLTLAILGAFTVTHLEQRRAGAAAAKSPAAAPPPQRWLPGPDQLDEVYADARSAYPAECCGFIQSRSVKPCRNAAADLASHGYDVRSTVSTGYALDLADLRYLAESLDSADPVRIVYHSHPDVGAYFSAEDARHAVIEGQPTYPVDHLVVDVTADEVRGARLYTFHEQQQEYVECAVFGDPSPRVEQPGPAPVGRS